MSPTIPQHKPNTLFQHIGIQTVGVKQFDTVLQSLFCLNQSIVDVLGMHHLTVKLPKRDEAPLALEGMVRDVYNERCTESRTQNIPGPLAQFLEKFCSTKFHKYFGRSQ